MAARTFSSIVILGLLALVNPAATADVLRTPSQQAMPSEPEAAAAAFQYPLACCPPEAWVAGQLIVGLGSGATLAAAELIAGRVGATVIRQVGRNQGIFLMAVPAGQELAYIPLFVSKGALYAQPNYSGCSGDIFHDCCCCPAGLICPGLPVCSTMIAEPRGSGFWKHQCGDGGFRRVTPDELDDALDLSDRSSFAYSYCAAAGCESMTEPSQPDMSAKVEKELQALWLNVTTCRVSMETSVNLPHLSTAATIGEAVWEIESTLCHGSSSRVALERVKALAEAINLSGEDLDLVVPAGDVAALAGTVVSFTLGVVNVGEGPFSLEVSAGSEWPVSLSSTQALDLGGGEGVPVIAQVEVPWWAEPGETFEVRLTAVGTSPVETQSRDAVVRLRIVDERIGRTAPRVDECR